MQLKKLPFIVMPKMPFISNALGGITIVTIGKFHICRTRIMYCSNCKGWEIVF